ncbi:hypothetical protein ADK86_25035 [Streptomyces sp. NRRL F-5755]|nr:hypothetical protein ADK86_25035 [Streptomyces sp. NRRL F-5755]
MRCRDIELVGACDTNPDVAAHLPVGIPVFSDVDAAFTATRPTMAIVATPHHTHFAITERLLRSGVAVLKEKPFALNVQEAHRLAQLIDDENGFLRLAVQRQFSKVFTQAKEALPDLGALRHFEAVYHLNTHPYGNTWRGDEKQAGGGAMLDMGYHTLDLIVSYFGMPHTVRAVQVPGRTGSENLTVEESAAAILEYASGLVGRIFLSRCESSKHESLSVTGTEGSLTVAPGIFRRRDKTGEETEVRTESRSAAGAGGEVLTTFLASMGDARIARAECLRGLQVMALTDALYTSLRGKAAVALPPVDLPSSRGGAALAGAS